MAWFRRLALPVLVRARTRTEILVLQQKLWRYVCKREDRLLGHASYFALSPTQKSLGSLEDQASVSGMGEIRSSEKKLIVETENLVTPVITEKLQ
jgi:hypothetical protein